MKLDLTNLRPELRWQIQAELARQLEREAKNLAMLHLCSVAVGADFYTSRELDGFREAAAVLAHEIRTALRAERDSPEHQQARAEADKRLKANQLERERRANEHLKRAEGDAGVEVAVDPHAG